MQILGMRCDNALVGPNTYYLRIPDERIREGY
jgi:hypothetical protein